MKIILLFLSLSLIGCTSRAKYTEAQLRQLQFEYSQRYHDIEYQIKRLENRMSRLEIQNRKSLIGKSASDQTRGQIRQKLEDSAHGYGWVTDSLYMSICESLLK
jgi:hypothetical protein